MLLRALILFARGFVSNPHFGYWIFDTGTPLGALGYTYQFVTLSGFHSVNHAMFRLACSFKDRGMAAYAELQSSEFAAEEEGYEATRHQEFVGAGYFDEVTKAATGNFTSTLALEGSTEEEQFTDAASAPAVERSQPESPEVVRQQAAGAD